MKFATNRFRVSAIFPATLGLLLFFIDSRAAMPDLKPGDGPEAFDQVKFWTMHALSTGEYTLVDEAIAKYADLDLRTLDGRAMLTGVDLGIARFSEQHALDRDALPEIQETRRQLPNSIAAILLEAGIWRAAAWSARGPGYASQVSDEGWKLFRARQEKAEAVLRSSRTIAGKSAIWYSMYLETLLELGRPASDLDTVFREGVARFPDYDQLYFEYLRAHLPQWSGSEQEPFAVVQAITNGGESDVDAIRYARMMWYIAQNAHFRENTDIFPKGAKWPVMQRGFQLIHERFPNSSWNATNFMSFACKANDSEAFAVWHEAAGAHSEKYALQIGMNMKMCEERFRPMSATQRRYERLIDTLNGPMADIIRSCGKNDARVVASFRAYMTQRNLIDKMEKEEKPEQPWVHAKPIAGLLQIDPENGEAICDGMGFSSQR